jgi:hypothetical protein
LQDLAARLYPRLQRGITTISVRPLSHHPFPDPLFKGAWLCPTVHEEACVHCVGVPNSTGPLKLLLSALRWDAQASEFQRELTSLRVALASFDHDRMLAFFDMPEKKGFVSLPHVLEVRGGSQCFLTSAIL